MAGRRHPVDLRDDDDTAFSIVGDEDPPRPDVEIVEEVAVRERIARVAVSREQHAGPFLVPEVPRQQERRSSSRARPSDSGGVRVSSAIFPDPHPLVPAAGGLPRAMDQGGMQSTVSLQMGWRGGGSGHAAPVFSPDLEMGRFQTTAAAAIPGSPSRARTVGSNTPPVTPGFHTNPVHPERTQIAASASTHGFLPAAANAPVSPERVQTAAPTPMLTPGFQTAAASPPAFLGSTPRQMESPKPGPSADSAVPTPRSMIKRERTASVASSSSNTDLPLEMPSAFAAGFRPQSLRPLIKVTSLPLFPVRSSQYAREQSGYPRLQSSITSDKDTLFTDPAAVAVIVCSSPVEREQNVLWSMIRRDFEDSAFFCDYTDLSEAAWSKPEVAFPMKVPAETRVVCAAGFPLPTGRKVVGLYVYGVNGGRLLAGDTLENCVRYVHFLFTCRPEEACRGLPAVRIFVSSLDLLDCVESYRWLLYRGMRPTTSLKKAFDLAAEMAQDKGESTLGHQRGMHNMPLAGIGHEEPPPSPSKRPGGEARASTSKKPRADGRMTVDEAVLMNYSDMQEVVHKILDLPAGEEFQPPPNIAGTYVPCKNTVAMCALIKETTLQQQKGANARLREQLEAAGKETARIKRQYTNQLSFSQTELDEEGKEKRFEKKRADEAEKSLVEMTKKFHAAEAERVRLIEKSDKDEESILTLSGKLKEAADEAAKANKRADDYKSILMSYHTQNVPLPVLSGMPLPSTSSNPPPPGGMQVPSTSSIPPPSGGMQVATVSSNPPPPGGMQVPSTISNQPPSGGMPQVRSSHNPTPLIDYSKIQVPPAAFESSDDDNDDLGLQEAMGMLEEEESEEETLSQRQKRIHDEVFGPNKEAAGKRDPAEGEGTSEAAVEKKPAEGEGTSEAAVKKKPVEGEGASAKSKQVSKPAAKDRPAPKDKPAARHGGKEKAAAGEKPTAKVSKGKTAAKERSGGKEKAGKQKGAAKEKKDSKRDSDDSDFVPRTSPRKLATANRDPRRREKRSGSGGSKEQFPTGLEDSGKEVVAGEEWRSDKSPADRESWTRSKRTIYPFRKHYYSDWYERYQPTLRQYFSVGHLPRTVVGCPPFDNKSPLGLHIDQAEQALKRLGELSEAFVGGRVDCEENFIVADWEGTIEVESETALKRFRTAARRESVFGFVLHELECRRREPLLGNTELPMVTSKGLTLATMAREIFTFQWSRNEHFICLNVLWNTLTASKNTFFGQRIKHSLQVLEEDHVIPQRALCYGNFIDINEMYAKLMPLPAQIKPLDSVFMPLENLPPFAYLFAMDFLSKVLGFEIPKKPKEFVEQLDKQFQGIVRKKYTGDAAIYEHNLEGNGLGARDWVAIVSFLNILAAIYLQIYGRILPDAIRNLKGAVQPADVDRSGRELWNKFVLFLDQKFREKKDKPLVPSQSFSTAVAKVMKHLASPHQIRAATAFGKETPAAAVSDDEEAGEEAVEAPNPASSEPEYIIVDPDIVDDDDGPDVLRGAKNSLTNTNFTMAAGEAMLATNGDMDLAFFQEVAALIAKNGTQGEGVYTLPSNALSSIGCYAGGHASWATSKAGKLAIETLAKAISGKEKPLWLVFYIQINRQLMVAVVDVRKKGIARIYLYAPRSNEDREEAAFALLKEYITAVWGKRSLPLETWRAPVTGIMHGTALEGASGELCLALFYFAQVLVRPETMPPPWPSCGFRSFADLRRAIYAVMATGNPRSLQQSPKAPSPTKRAAHRPPTPQAAAKTRSPDSDSSAVAASKSAIDELIIRGGQLIQRQNPEEQIQRQNPEEEIQRQNPEEEIQRQNPEEEIQRQNPEADPPAEEETSDAEDTEGSQAAVRGPSDHSGAMSIAESEFRMDSGEKSPSKHDDKFSEYSDEMF